MCDLRQYVIFLLSMPKSDLHCLTVSGFPKIRKFKDPDPESRSSQRSGFRIQNGSKYIVVNIDLTAFHISTFVSSGALKIWPIAYITSIFYESQHQMLVVNHMKIPNIAKNGLYYVENQYYLWFSGSADPKLLDPDLGSTDPASVDPDLTDPLGSLLVSAFSVV